MYCIKFNLLHIEIKISPEKIQNSAEKIQNSAENVRK